MYAVIRSGGKQYRVAQGETVQVESLEGKVGGQVTFDDIVAVRTDDKKILSGESRESQSHRKNREAPARPELKC